MHLSTLQQQVAGYAVSSNFAIDAKPISHRNLTHTLAREFAIPLLSHMQYKSVLPWKDKMTSMTVLVQ